MWLFLTDAWLSIVADKHNADRLMVRARKRADLERTFPDAQIIETPKADYPFRVFVSRDKVVALIADRVTRIDYGNFKKALIRDGRVHAAIGVHATLAAWGHVSHNTPERFYLEEREESDDP